VILLKYYQIQNLGLKQNIFLSVSDNEPRIVDESIPADNNNVTGTSDT
jgi:hypothetical protein